MSEEVGRDFRRTASGYFQGVVEAQDGGMSVPVSRTEMARQFSVTEDQVREIEREGSEPVAAARREE